MNISCFFDKNIYIENNIVICSYVSNGNELTESYLNHCKDFSTINVNSEFAKLNDLNTAFSQVSNLSGISSNFKLEKFEDPMWE